LILAIDGKINQALLCGNLDIAVNLCLEEERWTDALLLASKSSPEMLMKVQTKYFQVCLCILKLLNLI
jgi:protein transport protein SEC31